MNAEIDRPTPPRSLQLGAAQLYCDSCGHETPHRVLKARALNVDRQPRGVRGVARCRDCDFTHPFVSRPEATVEIFLVRSDGDKSTRAVARIPRDRRLLVGSGVLGAEGGDRIVRIDTQGGVSVADARSPEIRTIWATPDDGARVSISVLEGAMTQSRRVRLPPGEVIAVGSRMTLEDGAIHVHALRARGRTWRKPGDRFPARDIQRVYGRRIVRPPAGSKPWIRVRRRPRSRASSFSRSPRSRSGPGVRRKRSFPRDRRALGGPTVQRSTPS